MRALTGIGRGLPLASETRPRTARLVHVGVLALIVAWVLYLVYVISGPGWGSGADGIFKTFVFSGVLVAAAGVCLLRGSLITTDRVAWTVVGGGVGVLGAAPRFLGIFLEHLPG